MQVNFSHADVASNSKPIIYKGWYGKAGVVKIGEGCYKLPDNNDPDSAEEASIVQPDETFNDCEECEPGWYCWQLEYWCCTPASIAQCEGTPATEMFVNIGPVPDPLDSRCNDQSCLWNSTPYEGIYWYATRLTTTGGPYDTMEEALTACSATAIFPYNIDQITQNCT